MRFLVPFLIFLSVAQADPARVSSPVATEQFHELATSILDQLMAKGITKVGILDLADLRAKFAHVKVRLVDDQIEQIIGSGDAHRTAAVNVPSKKLVYVMYNQWQSSVPEVRPVIALHESLETAGVNDENYQASTLLWTLAQSPTNTPTDTLIRANADNFGVQLKTFTGNPRYFMKKSGGGATGVGGGGDDSCLFLKMIILDLIPMIGADELPAWHANLALIVMYTEIEPNMAPVDGPPVDIDNPDVTRVYRRNPTDEHHWPSFSIDRVLFEKLSVKGRGAVAAHILADLVAQP